MSHIGEYVSISATNAGAIIDALIEQLKQTSSMEDYYKGQVVQLSADNASQDAEIKRLQGELAAKNAKPEDPAHKFKVGDRVIVLTENDPAHQMDTITAIDWSGIRLTRPHRHHGGNVYEFFSAADLSPAPLEAPDGTMS